MAAPTQGRRSCLAEFPFSAGMAARSAGVGGAGVGVGTVTGGVGSVAGTGGVGGGVVGAGVTGAAEAAEPAAPATPAEARTGLRPKCSLRAAMKVSTGFQCLPMTQNI